MTQVAQATQGFVSGIKESFAATAQQLINHVDALADVLKEVR